MMSADTTGVRLAALSDRLKGRAAGAWRVSGDRLEQVAFHPAPDMPPDVAEAFASATRSVDLARRDLGIVNAVASAEVVVSRAQELPPDVGSGYWLRAFDASRSVAVPIRDEAGEVVLVVSMALGPEPADQAVASAIRSVPWAD